MTRRPSLLPWSPRAPMARTRPRRSEAGLTPEHVGHVYPERMCWYLALIAARHVVPEQRRHRAHADRQHALIDVEVGHVDLGGEPLGDVAHPNLEIQRRNLLREEREVLRSHLGLHLDDAILAVDPLQAGE